MYYIHSDFKNNRIIYNFWYQNLELNFYLLMIKTLVQLVKVGAQNILYHKDKQYEYTITNFINLYMSNVTSMIN